MRATCQHRSGVAVENALRDAVDHGEQLEDVRRLDGPQVRRGQKRRRRLDVCGCEQHVEGRADLPALLIVGCGALERCWIGSSEGREVLANRPRQLPPTAIGAAQGKAEGERAVEEAVVRGDGGQELAVEQRQRSDLREPARAPARSAPRTGHRASERPARWGRPRSGFAGSRRSSRTRLVGALRARSCQDRGRRPASRCGIQQPSLVDGDGEAEARPAQLERLLRAQRKICGVDPAFRPPRSRSAPGRLRGNQNRGTALEPKPTRDACDEHACAARRVMPVVDHERAGLVRERVDHRVDGARRIVPNRRHRAGRVDEAGAADGRVQAACEQLCAHARLRPSSTSIGTAPQTSTSSAPSTVFPYPPAASTTTTCSARHCSVSRERRMWWGGSRLIVLVRRPACLCPRCARSRRSVRPTVALRAPTPASPPATSYASLAGPRPAPSTEQGRSWAMTRWRVPRSDAFAALGSACGTLCPQRPQG